MKALSFLFLVISSSWTANIAHAADSRADFLKLIARPEVPLAPEISKLPPKDDVDRYHFSFATEAGQRVPGILFKLPGEIRRPAVIALHGTGGNKMNFNALLTRLARLGFVAIAIDGRYHGERTKSGGSDQEYQEAITRAWNGSREHPFFYDTVWDVIRLLDYLQTRDDVDASRIGLIGISKGGIETYLAAAVDPRIAVAVPCIGVQSFRWALDHDAWRSRVGTIQKAFDAAAAQEGEDHPGAAFARRFYDRIVPGIYGEFDGPAMLPLIAPRPLLVINGDSDARTPMPGLEECVAAATAAYRSDKASDRLSVLFEKDTAHQVKPEAEQGAVDWFVRWLKPQK